MSLWGGTGLTSSHLQRCLLASAAESWKKGRLKELAQSRDIHSPLRIPSLPARRMENLVWTSGTWMLPTQLAHWVGVA